VILLFTKGILLSYSVIYLIARIITVTLNEVSNLEKAARKKFQGHQSSVEPLSDIDKFG
jgi:hypothetical protein